MIDELPDPRRLASSPAPEAALSRLAACPVHRLPDGSYVVSRPADVTAALEDPRVEVTALEPDPRIATLQASMARFVDGAPHRRVRALTEDRLAALDLASLRWSVTALVEAHVAGASVADVLPLARRFPALALAGALGIDGPARAVEAVDLLVRRLAPMPIDHPRPPADAVVDALEACFGPLDAGAVDIAILFQAVDATAALIAHRLSGDSASPIHTTTRTTRAPSVIGGTELPAGARLVVALAAAAGDDPDLWFGHGRHACPGSDVACALADGFCDGLDGAGFSLDGSDAPTSWEPRPNLRLPSSLVLRRR